MGKDAKINMYRVAKCGYYNGNTKKPKFCDLGLALADLNTWITKDQPKVRETQTFQPGEDSNSCRSTATACSRIPNIRTTF